MKNNHYICTKCGKKIQDTTRMFCPNCFNSIALPGGKLSLDRTVQVDDSIHHQDELINARKEVVGEDEIIKREKIELPVKSGEEEILTISGFGCFKVDIDPRKPQDVRTRDDLYFFLDGTLKTSYDLLVFDHLYHNPGDLIHTIKVREVRDFKWHNYDKNRHEVFGQEIRYLMKGIRRNSWWEVGYFWLPGGRSTEMECIITEQNGRESYFYFRGTPENLKAIEKMREYIQKIKLQRV